MVRFLTAVGLALVCSASALAQNPGKPEKAPEPSSLPEVIWRDPGDIPSLNLVFGVGGMGHAPRPDATYTFVEEDLKGTSPKIKVQDSQGVEWKVKMGAEPQAETAATRLLWAAGFFVDEDYYAAEIKVEGLTNLRRGKKFVSDGVVHNVRLERKIAGEKKLGDWSWFQNPFLNTREFNALRVMMALMNNWDLKEVNNSVYRVDREREYAVADLGATFGKTGNQFTRSKSNPRDYENSRFIQKTTENFVDFTMHSRPFFLSVIRLSHYKMRSRMERITKHVPRSDARWLGQRLAQLSDEQIRDCFRSAGYTPEQVNEYFRTVKARIAELNAL